METNSSFHQIQAKSKMVWELILSEYVFSIRVTLSKVQVC